MLFYKKCGEFSGGGNDICVFLKKGNHPPPSSRAESRAEPEALEGMEERSRTECLKEGRVKRIKAEPTEGRKTRADGRKCGRQRKAEDSQCGRVRIATFIFHWKLFPLRAIARIKYQSKNNNINLSLINIFCE